MSLKNSINKLRQAMAASVDQTMMGSNQPMEVSSKPKFSDICPPVICYSDYGGNCMKYTTYYRGKDCNMIHARGSEIVGGVGGRCPELLEPKCSF
jgi:hypothetical protein